MKLDLPRFADRLNVGYEWKRKSKDCNKILVLRNKKVEFRKWRRLWEERDQEIRDIVDVEVPVANLRDFEEAVGYVSLEFRRENQDGFIKLGVVKTQA